MLSDNCWFGMHEGCAWVDGCDCLCHVDTVDLETL